MTNQARTKFFTKFEFNDFDELKKQYSKYLGKISNSDLDFFSKIIKRTEIIQNYFMSINESINRFPVQKENYQFTYGVYDHEFSGERKSLEILQNFNFGKDKYKLSFNLRTASIGSKEYLETNLEKKKDNHFEKIYSKIFNPHPQLGKIFFQQTPFYSTENKNNLINKLIEEIPKSSY